MLYAWNDSAVKHSSRWAQHRPLLPQESSRHTCAKETAAATKANATERAPVFSIGPLFAPLAMQNGAPICFVRSVSAEHIRFHLPQAGIWSVLLPSFAMRHALLRTISGSWHSAATLFGSLHAFTLLHPPRCWIYVSCKLLEQGYIVRVFSSKPVDPLSASSIQAYRAGENDIFEHVGRRGQVLWTRPTSKYDRVGMLAQRIVQVLAALHVLHRSVLAPTESMCARADGVEDGKIGAVGRGRRRGRVAGCLDAARSHRAVRAGADGHKTGGHAGQRERKRVQAASRRGAKS